MTTSTEPEEEVQATSLWREQGIATPEGVVLDFDRAGVTSRAVARIIDVFVLLLLLTFGGNFLALLAAASSTAAVVGLLVLVFLLIFVYPVVLETLWRGRTVGKSVLGLRVITSEGASVRVRHAAIRSILQLVDIIATLGGAAVVVALSSPEGQRLGDMAAGTYVVRERRSRGEIDEREVVFRVPNGYQGVAAGIDPTLLKPAQMAVVRSFLVRSTDLDSTARASLAVQLADKVATVLGTEVPPGVHPETWLACVAVAVQRRSGSTLPPPTGQPRS